MEQKDMETHLNGTDKAELIAGYYYKFLNAIIG